MLKTVFMFIKEINTFPYFANNMHYLNDQIDLREEFSFFFTCNHELKIHEYGKSYLTHMKITQGNSANEYFNLPWGELSNSSNIP